LNKPALVLSMLMSLLVADSAFAAKGDPPPFGATTFAQRAARPDPGPYTGARPPLPADVRGTITVFTSRATFNAAFPGLTLEDFEGGNAAAGGFSVCDAPLDSSGDATCGFAPGELLSGFAVQDNPIGPSAGSMILLGNGTSLNATNVIVSNTFADSFDIIFNPPIDAAGMDLHSTPGPGEGPPDVLAVTIFDASDTLIGSDPAAAGSGPGNFWGVSSTTPIRRINILSSSNAAEGIDNLAFNGVPLLSLGSVTSMDVCSSLPALNNNLLNEPGETINFTIPVNATGGAFTNVMGMLTSSTPGVTIVSGIGNYGNIASGGSASANYSISLAESATCGAAALSLTLNLTSTEGNASFPLARDIGGVAAITYTGLPLAIPDATPSGASSTATVANVPGPLTSVQVRVATTHTWVGDLIYTLTSPMGTVVTLLDRPGVPASGAGCNNDNVNVTFADGQPNPESICGTGIWPVTNAAPVTPLSALNGQNANGTWTLTISDNAGQDLGTLTEWELILVPAPVGSCNVCPGGNADVSIVKTANAPTPLAIGSTIVYTLAVSNAGPGGANGIVVTDTLPANVTYVSNSCGATFAAGTITWNAGTLANLGSVSCNITVTVNAVGQIDNTATASTASTDPTPANNSSTSTLAGVLSADLAVALSAPTNTTTLNSPVVFSATSTNLGPSPAQDVQLTITLAPDFRFASFSAPGATCTTPQLGLSGAITCTWAGPTAALAVHTLQVTAASGSPGISTIQASTTSLTSDPDLSNNTTTVTVTAEAEFEPIPALGLQQLLILLLAIGALGAMALTRR
jgi:uncharacterized repeat protein (TIGR01451 family)